MRPKVPVYPNLGSRLSNRVLFVLLVFFSCVSRSLWHFLVILLSRTGLHEYAIISMHHLQHRFMLWKRKKGPFWFFKEQGLATIGTRVVSLAILSERPPPNHESNLKTILKAGHDDAHFDPSAWETKADWSLSLWVWSQLGLQKRRTEVALWAHRGGRGKI